MALYTKYGYQPDEEGISRNLSMIAGNIANANDPDLYRSCFAAMDLTTLKATDNPSTVGALAAKVNNLQDAFPDMPSPASICVYSNLVPAVKSSLTFPGVGVTAVAGAFPAAQTFLELKVKECELAIAAGADEIDVVMPVGLFLSGDYDAVSNELSAIRHAIDTASPEKHITLKIIIESGILVTAEKIADASFLAMECGADFIKTSTGKVEVNATPQAAYVMCQCIALFAQRTGRKVGVKAAGGISSAADAAVDHSIVSTVLGPGWLDRNHFRLGVSRLGNSLISAIQGSTVVYF